jgi:hypothetical protein
MRLRLVHLYPDLMSLYGDRGNIISLERRCAWRGLELEVANVSLGDRIDPKATDILFFGGGQDREQDAVSRDLQDGLGGAVAEAVEDGAALLAVCGGYQLLGHYFRTAEGTNIPGTGLFDVHTVAGSKRMVGDVVAEATLDASSFGLVGFENHSGKTFLGTAVEPLARVQVGHGNNGEDHLEGARYKHAVGTYLHGPILPKNPRLADWLILGALRRRVGPDAMLEPLDDSLESAAHAQVAARVRREGRRPASIR